MKLFQIKKYNLFCFVSSFEKMIKYGKFKLKNDKMWKIQINKMITYEKIQLKNYKMRKIQIKNGKKRV